MMTRDFFSYKCCSISPCLDWWGRFWLILFCLPYRIHLALGPPPPWRWQEAQEEELHHSQKDQAQAQEGQTGRVEVLQGGRQRQDQPPEEGVPCRGVRRRRVHGGALWPAVLWQVRPHICFQQTRGQIRATNVPSINIWKLKLGILLWHYVLACHRTIVRKWSG